MNLQAVVELIDKMSGPLGKINGVISEFTKGVTDGAKAELELAKNANTASAGATKLSGALKTVGVALAGLASAKVIFDGFSTAIIAADALDDLSAKIGGTAGELQGLQYAAAQSGANLNTLVSGLDRLSRSASMSEEESSRQAAAFEALGISTKNAEGNLKTSEVLFSEIAEAFEGLKNGPEKSAIAFAIFGGQARELIPLLNEGADGLEKLKGEVQDFGGLGTDAFTEFAAESAKLMDNTDRVKLIFTNLFTVLAADVVPVLNILVEETIRSYKEGGVLRSVIDGISNVFRNVFVPAMKISAQVVNAFVSTVEIAGKGIGALGAIVAKVAQGDFRGARQVWQAYKGDVAQIAQNHVDFTARLNETGKAAAATAETVEKRTAPSLVRAGKAAKEAKSELEGMLRTLRFENATFGLDEAAKKVEEARAKFSQDIAAGVNPERARAMLNETLQQIELNKALRDGAEAKQRFDDAGKTVVEMNQAVQVLELEAKMIGASKEERDAAIQAMIDEAEIRKITTGLTDDAAKAITEEIKALQARRNEAKGTIDDNARLNNLLSNTWAEKSKQAMLDIEFLHKAYISGRIASEEQYVEAVKMRLAGLTDSTKKELDTMTEFWMEAARGIQNTMSSFLFDVMQGKITNLGDRFKQMLDRMVADALAANLANALFGRGFTQSGDLGGWLGQAMSFLGNSFGGARANGGSVQAGKMYLVGEKGPEPFIPSVSGTILPNSAMRGMSSGQSYQVNITAMDSQDVRRALEKDFRWLADGVNRATRAYNLGV